jgi:hypothetical protein
MDVRISPARLLAEPSPSRIARWALYIALLALGGLQGQIRASAAGSVVFKVDPARSYVSVSGSVTISGVGTYVFQQQGAGSLTASYTGSILVALAPPTISFPGGSAIQANNSGTWQPAAGGASGTAPANYGILVQPLFTTGYAAFRNTKLDLTGPPVLLTNGGFDAGHLMTTYLTNTPPPPTMDFLVSSLLPSMSTNGTALLTGTGTNSPGTAYLTNGLGLLTLVVPVGTTNSATIGDYPVTVILRGQIVATAPATAWPLQVSMGVQPGLVMLTWPSLPGQSFFVQTKANLNAAWSLAGGTITVHSNTTTWTASAGGSAGFYRVVGSY